MQTVKVSESGMRASQRFLLTSHSVATLVSFKHAQTFLCSIWIADSSIAYYGLQVARDRNMLWGEPPHSGFSCLPSMKLFADVEEAERSS